MTDKRVIDISIGHSMQARGAKGVYGEQILYEYDFNCKVRTALEELIQKVKPGYWRPRYWDHSEHPQWGVREKKSESGEILERKLVVGKILTDRVKAMFADRKLEPQSRVAIELHCNASRNTKFGGFMAIYRMEKDSPTYGTFEDEKGKVLATCIQQAFTKAFPELKDRKIQADQGDWVGRDLGFTRWGYRYDAVPVIIEFGFITCPNDQKVIADEGTPAKYAKALVEAIDAYLIKESIK